MLKRVSAFLASTLLATASLFVMAPMVAHAAARTWDGGGSDDNFSTAANWSGDTAPGNGDSIIIPYDVVLAGCSGDVTLNNDLDNSTVTLAGISFVNDKPDSCFNDVRIDGNGVKVSGDILGNDVDDGFPRAYFDIHITATAPLTIQSIGSTGSLSIGSNDVTINGSSFEGGVTGSGDLTITGYPGGAGGGCPTTATASPFSGDSSGFSGSVTVQTDGGMTITDQANDIANHASSITKAADGLLSFNTDNGQDMTSAVAITFNGGTVYASQMPDSDCNDGANKTITLSGNITLTADTTFSLGHVNLHFSGTVTGQDHVKIASSSFGNITFADNSTLEPQPTETAYNANSPSTSIFVNNNETATVDGTYGTTTVGEGGVLKGTGTVGDLTVSVGGTVAPGHSPGCLNSGNFTLNGAFDVELGGTTACSEYDQMKVTGTVDLSDGTLNITRYNDFKPAANQTYVIIDNDGSDAVTGTLQGVAEGGTVTSGGYAFRVSYVSGDGNDVTLTVISVPNTGFEMIYSHPLMTLVVTTTLAGGIALLARRYRTVMMR